jgi:hypothetical protein
MIIQETALISSRTASYYVLEYLLTNWSPRSAENVKPNHAMLWVGTMPTALLSFVHPSTTGLPVISIDPWGLTSISVSFSGHRPKLILSCQLTPSKKEVMLPISKKKHFAYPIPEAIRCEL